MKQLLSALTLVACASSPPPRPATEVAVGSEPWNRIQLREWAIELPLEALSHVQIAWREGERRAELSLTGAAIGSSVERLADDEASSMRALDPDVEIVRRRLRIAGVAAIGLRQGERDVVVAMRNPWRVFRLALRGGSAEDWLGSEESIAGIGIRPQWDLERAHFQSEAYSLTVSRREDGDALVRREDWALHLRVRTTAPEDDELTRIRDSFAVR